MRRLTRRTAVAEPPRVLWSPAQLFAVLIGGAAIAYGAWALTRTGLDLSHLRRPERSFLGFHHTPLLALAEIGFGVLLLLAALRPFVGRNLMTLVGAAALGLGVVVLAHVWPGRMHRWLGVHDRNGWLFIAVGGFAMLMSFLPVFGFGTRRTVREEVAREPEQERVGWREPTGPPPAASRAPEPVEEREPAEEREPTDVGSPA